MENSSHVPQWKLKLHAFVTHLRNHPYQYIALLSLLSSLIVGLFYFTAVSLLYPAYSSDGVGLDSNFFILGGKVLLDGGKLYLDFFDHKGILAFLPSMLGYMIAGYYGVCIINFIVLYISTFSILCLIKEVCTTMGGLYLASAIYTFLWAICLGGNANGLYVLTFVSLAYLFFVKGIKNDSKKDFYIGSFIGGLEIGLAFNIRPTDGLVILPLYLFLFVVCIKKVSRFTRDLSVNVNWKQLLLNAALAVGGFLIPIAICWGYIYAQGSNYFSEMIRSVFEGETTYLMDSRFLSSTIGCLIAVILFALACCFMIFRLFKKNKELATFLFVTNLLNIIFNFVFLRFTHYWICYFPSILLVLVTYFRYYPLHFKTSKREIRCSHTRMATILTTINVLIGVVTLTIYQCAPESFMFSKAYSESIDKEIDENISEEEQHTLDNVLVLDISTAVLIKHEIKTTIRYKGNQSAQAHFLVDIEIDIMNYLQEKKPTYVVRSEDPFFTDTDLKYYRYVNENYTVMNDNYPGNQVSVFKLNA